MMSFRDVVSLVIDRAPDEPIWRTFREGFREGHLLRAADVDVSTVRKQQALLKIRRDTLGRAGIPTPGFNILLERLEVLDPEMKVTTATARIGRRMFVILTAPQVFIGGFTFEVEEGRASRLGWHKADSEPE